MCVNFINNMTCVTHSFQIDLFAYKLNYKDENCPWMKEVFVGCDN